MSRFVISLVMLTAVCGTWGVANAFNDSWQKQQSLLKPYKQNAYGSGVNSDATGRPFKWQTQDGQDVAPNTRVKPDAYGPGIGMDEYGRPVKTRPW
jgi:hypothetical protein